MPLTDVIEPLIVVSRSTKKIIEERLMLGGVSDKVRGGTAAQLNGNIDNSECFSLYMFADENTADLTRSTAEFLAQSLNYFLGQQ